MTKVIYMGLPMKLDQTTDPPTLSGFWSWVCRIHFNGVFLTYTGSYPRALWHWLFHQE